MQSQKLIDLDSILKFRSENETNESDISFSGHGRVDIEVNHSIVVVTVHGQLNKEKIQDHFMAMKNTLKDVIKTPWALIQDYRNWELTTPDSSDTVQKLINWFSESNLQLIADIFHPEREEVQKFCLQQQADRETLGIERVSFKNRQSAIQWLESRGFSWSNHSSF